MIKFEIKSRWDASVVLFTADLEDGILPELQIGAALKIAVKAKANLDGANLYGANLTRANLYGANLTRANLTRANLYGANLDGANLNRANLDGANLTGANLDGANLTRANLDGANLDGANLYGANLTRANLDGANLTPIRDDIWAVLCSAPAEATALRAALAEGRVNGSAYEGRCSCLVGTLATAKGVAYSDIAGLSPNSNRPAERFFMGINEGDTPETNPLSKLALEWVDQWIANMNAAFGKVAA